jgi:uncharacterized protein (TIGR02001 family)
MRNTLLSLSAVLLASVSAPALADDTSAVTISGNASVVSDYRFRGISQTDKRFAVQGGFTVAHESGVYGTVWGSSVDNVYPGATQEIDFSAGYKKAIGAATVDVGVLYYYYPGTNGIASDFIEPYASVSSTFGPATAKVSVAYAPKQHALYSGLPGRTRDDNLYTAFDLSGALPSTPVTLTAHVGHSFGPSFLVPAPKKGYTDWSLGASYSYKNLSFGVSYVDTDTKYLVGTRDAAKAGVVGTVGVSF